MNEIIDLDQNKKFGFFWDFFTNLYKISFTFDEYINGLHSSIPNILYIKYKNHLYKMNVYKSQWKYAIKIHWGNCLIYTLKKNEDYLESELSEYSTNCEDIILGNLKIIGDKSEFLLTLIDAISICFGIKKIMLIDAATAKYNTNIDLSLYNVMKYGNTFYEKYGFIFCDKDIDFNIHKKLLKNFDFNVFLYLLSKNDKDIVDKMLKKIKTPTSLGDFFVNIYDYYYIKNDNKIVDIQKILTNNKYPWYSMVSIIIKKKECMIKYF